MGIEIYNNIVREKLFADFVKAVCSEGKYSVSFNPETCTLKDSTTGLEVDLIPKTENPSEQDLLRFDFAMSVAGRTRPAAVVWNRDTQQLERTQK